MTPILFDRKTTNFSSQGLGRLSDAIVCQATEERNGIFELFLTYPIDGKLASEIILDRIIVAKPSETQDPQAFRIYSISEPINNIIEINAEHISYALSKIPATPFTASNLTDTLDGLMANAAGSLNFYLTSDMTTTKPFSVLQPTYIRSALGGEVMEIYGGEYEWDNYNVRLLASRGQDRGAVVKYGYNMTGFDNEINQGSIYTAILPYWQKREVTSAGDGVADSVYLPEKIIEAPGASTYGELMIKIVDFSSHFQDKPTVAQLRAAATDYMDNSSWQLNQNLTVDFVNIWDTVEKEGSNIDRVVIGLCDTIRVIHPRYGIDQKMKVIKTVYDVISERYTEIELGELRTSLGEAIIQRYTETTGATTGTAIAAANDTLVDYGDRIEALEQGGGGGGDTTSFVKGNTTLGTTKPMSITMDSNQDPKAIVMSSSPMGVNAPGINDEDGRKVLTTQQGAAVSPTSPPWMADDTIDAPKLRLQNSYINVDGIALGLMAQGMRPYNHTIRRFTIGIPQSAGLTVTGEVGWPTPTQLTNAAVTGLTFYGPFLTHIWTSGGKYQVSKQDANIITNWR